MLFFVFFVKQTFPAAEAVFRVAREDLLPFLPVSV
jgi:hypothetical protein